LLSLDANWQILQTEEYAMHSHDFRHAAAGLIAASQKKNLDGAVLAYFQMTQSCVNCHRHVRDQR
jgi:cytochrome c556